MGCCSKKKSAKSKKTVSLRADEGTVFEITVSVLQLVPKKGGANASNKSKKALPVRGRATVPGGILYREQSIHCINNYRTCSGG